MQRGQVVERGEGKFLIRAYVGSVEGKRKYASKMICGTRKEAEVALTALLAANDSGELPPPSTVTVGEFLGRWLASRSDLREKTRIDYEGLLRHHVVPVLGPVKLQLLSAPQIQRLYSSLLSEKELSPRTIQYVHVVLKQALTRAVEWRLIRWNPAEHLSLPRLPRKEMKSLSVDETKRFLSSTEGARLGPLWRLLLTTGLRPSEALALQWRDLEGEWLVVRRSLAAEGIVDETKTGAGVRRISVPKSLQLLLECQRSVPEGFIFAWATGNPMDLSSIRKEWKRALADAGLPPARLYDARHTHLSQLLSAGVNVKAVAHRAGHSNPSILLKTYAHCLPEVERRSAEVIEEVLG